MTSDYDDRERKRELLASRESVYNADEGCWGLPYDHDEYMRYDEGLHEGYLGAWEND